MSNTKKCVLNLNDTISEYYKNYGQNRDLEKYFRLSNSNSNHVQIENETSVESMEGGGVIKDDNEHNELAIISNLEKRDFKECDVKEQNKTKRASKSYTKLVYNFDAESNISIALPVDTVLLNNNEHNESLPKKSVTIEEDSNNIMSEDVRKIKLDASVQTYINDDDSLENSTLSNKRLEWDSLGDVGYNKKTTQQNYSKQITTLEKSVLKNYFFDKEKKFIVNNVTSVDNCISMNAHTSDMNETSIKTDKSKKVEKLQIENWRKILHSKKQKYNISDFSTAMVNDSKTVNTHIDIVDRLKLMPAESSHSIQIDEITNKDIFQHSFDNGTSTSASFNYYAECTNNVKSMELDISQTNNYLKHKRRERDSKQIKLENNSMKHTYSNARQLNIAINLLCTLMESKNLNEGKKVKLAEKIVRKIRKYKQISTSSTDITENSSSIIHTPPKLSFQCTESNSSINDGSFNKKVDPFLYNNKSKINCTTQADKIIDAQMQNESKSIANTEMEWLDPLTKSELKYELKNNTEIKTYNQNLPQKKVNDIMLYFEQEKRFHLNWIQNEIRHLKNLQTFLNETVLNEQYSNSRSTILGSSHDKSTTNSSTVSSLNRVSPYSTHENNEVKFFNYTNSSKNSSTEDKIYASQPFKKATDSKLIDECRLKNTNNQKIRKHNSHEKKQENFRSKLQTPSYGNSNCYGDKSINSFARIRKKKFLENYKNFKTLVNNDYYSKPQTCTEHKNLSNTKSCSSNISDFNMSSKSISIDCRSNSSTTTTTHRYDNHITTAVQTSNSLLKMPEVRNKTTILIAGKHDKQVQVKPKSESYLVSFCNNNMDVINTSYQEYIPIKDYLKKNLPQFEKNVIERQQILKYSINLRKERRQNIHNIILKNESIGDRIKCLKLPQTDYKRIFSVAEMKEITNRNYQKLPEIIAKNEREINIKQKKENKIIVEIFNKKLQRRVLSGMPSVPCYGTFI